MPKKRLFKSEQKKTCIENEHLIDHYSTKNPDISAGVFSIFFNYYFAAAYLLLTASQSITFQNALI